MGKAGLNYQRIILDVCDPELTKCWVFIQATGDAPIGVHGWHHKTFGASVSTLDVLTKWGNGEEDPLLWPLAAPEEMPAAAATPAPFPSQPAEPAEP